MYRKAGSPSSIPSRAKNLWMTKIPHLSSPRIGDYEPVIYRPPVDAARHASGSSMKWFTIGQLIRVQDIHAKPKGVFVR